MTSIHLDFILLSGVFLLTALLLLRRSLRAEQNLHQEQERAQVTLYSITDGVITTDSRGLVVYLNPVAESLTGWNAEQARGLPLSNVYAVIDEQTRQPLPATAAASGGWCGWHRSGARPVEDS